MNRSRGSVAARVVRERRALRALEQEADANERAARNVARIFGFEAEETVMATEPRAEVRS